MLRSVVALIVLAGLAGGAPAFAGDAGLGEGRAEMAGLSSAALARVDSTIEAAIRNGATPGAALAVGRHGELVRLRGYGRLTYAADAAAITDSTLFDLASLTKVVGTTTALMLLVDQGRIDLDTPIYQYLPSWPSMGMQGSITLRHLLTHTSGLPAGADLWTVRGRDARISKIAQLRLVAPPGVQTLYSDLGMVVAGAVIESVTGERLDDFLEREVFAPLRMRETLFNPKTHMLPESPLATAAPIVVELAHTSLFFEPFTILAAWADSLRAPAPIFSAPQVRALAAGRILDRTQIAPTEFDPARHAALQGVVHDPTAAALGGVAGNAGLFSSARDLAVFGQWLLDAAAHGVDLPIVSAATVSMFVARSPGVERGLGWDMPAGRSSAGDYFSASSFGHTGYTGTSIWIDPERDLFVVLLTNRVYPSAANEKHKALRRAVHDEVELAIEDEVVAAR
ncbi:MAG TPA: serine hydrolase [Longimicrobiales bacterium]